MTSAPVDLGDLGHRVDEADLRGEERVRRRPSRARPSRSRSTSRGVPAAERGRVDLVEHVAPHAGRRPRRRAGRARACPSRRTPRAGTRGSTRGSLPTRLCDDRRRVARPCRPARCSCRRRGRPRRGTAAARRSRRRRTAGRRRSTSVDCGVPTATKCTVAPAASAMSVVKRSRPVATAGREDLGQARLEERSGRPPRAARSCAGSTSIPTTSWPSSAIAEAWTAPR